MACYILELWLHAEMLKLENVSTELWSESLGKNYLCGCAQLSSRVRSAFAEVQQSFYWSNLNIMVACSREIHLIFQIFSTRKKYINVIKDRFKGPFPYYVSIFIDLYSIECFLFYSV